jgi:hypothetical protein
VTEIRTRDEALTAVDHGLGQWAAEATGALTQARAMVDGARSMSQSKVRRLENEVAAIEALLGSLRPEDDLRRAQRSLAQARQSLQAAQTSAQRIALVAEQLAALERTQVSSAAAAVGSARADLRRRLGTLAAYRTPAGGSAHAAGADLSSAGAPGWLDGRGLTDVEVSAVDLAGAPAADAFDRRDVSLADHRWAVQTWEEVVRPGVAGGMTRADFEARDVQRAATEMRQTAKVYDLFLGEGSRLRVARLPDGTLDVRNGYHRFKIARDLGIRYLPAQVIDA